MYVFYRCSNIYIYILIIDILHIIYSHIPILDLDYILTIDNLYRNSSGRRQEKRPGSELLRQALGHAALQQLADAAFQDAPVTIAHGLRMARMEPWNPGKTPGKTHGKMMVDR